MPDTTPWECSSTPNQPPIDPRNDVSKRIAQKRKREAAGSEVVLYTDGACKGNPGPGGWAFILHHPESGKTMERSGARHGTTNNQMELQAVIEGLKSLKRPASVRIVTDSSYVEKGLLEWSPNWKSNGWRRRTSDGFKPVKNVEFWKELDQLSSRHEIQVTRVRGHAGHPENERCDQLAVNAYMRLIENG